MSRRWLFTSESVTEGHPDKVADQISDAVLDEVLANDPDPDHARVACETLVTTGMIVVAGEISTDTYIDIAKVARDTVIGIGYDRASAGFDGNTCGVMVALDEQSPDIAGGVDKSLESREDSTADDLDTLGAGDQGMMFGYACRETDVLMPMPIHLAHRLAERLAAVRKAGVVGYLRPDGKTQVTVEYEGNTPVRVSRVLISTQHQPDIDTTTLLAPDLIEHVIAPVIPDELEWRHDEVLINPSGRFEHGGPQADAGLTGRKIIVDTYGGMARHGGGAFSGKDSTKVDRSGAYAARWVTKTIVAAGLADRAELQVAYAIGVAHPISLSLETFGTETHDPDKILAGVGEVFDLRPAAIIRDLALRKPVFKSTAVYGHFGRSGFAWEGTDRADDLRSAAGA
ncbi:MAG: methionine adenosyltransferase [Actinomycetota bacterium]|jgi:S-adenosylmethionine synthetase|nr:methionine adenosyltransferase [Euzebyaceae bacterium]MDQ3453602.1 methionine adenosyltransferase [Actinomycetota bacterium]